MAYIYRGTIHDLHETIQDERSDEFNQSLCGTRKGYRQHQRLEIPICEDCRDANTAYQREYMAARRSRPPVGSFDRSKCGTRAGYAAHTYYGVPHCGHCKAVNAKHSRNHRSAREA